MKAPDSTDMPGAIRDSAWSPLRSSVFTVVWLASIVGSVGTWIRDVGAGWLMTSLSTSATHVALVQVATTLPIFLLSLPGGALADVFNRRSFLLFINALLVVIAGLMGVVTATGMMTPSLLIASLFVAGIGAALAQPVTQSLTPLLVPRSQLRSAVALNSLGFNIARAIGPAIAGAILTFTSVAVIFFVDALSYVAVIAALWWWKGAATPASKGVPERFVPAMRAGVRYALHSRPLKRTVLRASSYFFFASALWALLPLIARKELGGGPAYYSALLTCVGAGAVAGAVLLPKLRSKTSTEGVMRIGMAVTIAVLVTLAFVKNQVVAAIAMSFMGAAWISVLTSANVSAQAALPDWVRGRGLAIYLTAFYGSMTIGSLVWGAVADSAGVPVALAAAAAAGLPSFALSFFKPLASAEIDLTPSMHWPEPAISAGISGSLNVDRGPVLITVEYMVEQADTKLFLDAIHEFREERLRDGALEWGVYEDMDRQGRFIEHFLVGSWQEHLRQHLRVSRADAELQAIVVKYHKGEESPRVEHLIAPLPN